MLALKGKLQLDSFILICHLWTCLAEIDAAYNYGNSRAAFPSLDCTFTSGICSWRHSSLENELKWGISELNADHTTGTSFYLRLYNDQEATFLRGRLRSPPVQASYETCLTFWYFMKDSDVGELSVFRIESARSEKHRLFRVFGAQGNRWYRAVVPTGSGDFQLEIIGTVDNAWPKSGVGLDDISLSYEKCSQTDVDSTKYRPSIACDFEEDLCSWYTPIESKQVKWTTTTAPTDAKDRYPLPPFTGGKRVASLVRLADSYNAGAKLQGPTISVDSRQACFSFWYKIQGGMIKGLEVVATDFSYPHETVFSITYGKRARSTWIQANLTLPERESIYIVFSAMTLRRRSGLVLLDDINISYEGPCSKENQADFINCDFEKDLCRWYLESETGENDWSRLQGPTPTNSTGPSRDHTTGDGHYVYFDASKLKSQSLFSQDISVDSKGACFSFWYHMYGKDVYTLELLLDQEQYSTQTLWSLEGSQEDQWLQQNVSLPPFHQERGRLMFRAESVYFPRGDIAIDDVSVVFGTDCESDSPEPIEPDEFEEEFATTEPPETMTDLPSPTTTEITELPTPRLILKDGHTTVYEASHVQFVCQIYTNLTVQTAWYRQREGRMRLRQVGSDSLIFDEIQIEEGGTFACAIKYGSDVTSDLSNFVTVTVVEDPRRKPYLYSSEPFSSLEVEKIVTFACGFAEVEGFTYHWKTTSSAFAGSTLPNARELVLNGTKREHSGTYSCRISKDKFLTAKSNELKVSVEPGKYCDYNWQCSGIEYKVKCQGNRCKCAKNAVPVGPRCLFKPEQPKILTFPRFLEYGIGESFYLICRARTPAPPMMVYTFITPKGQIETHGVMKITQATAEDSGYYQCFVTNNNVTSRNSNNIIVQIKDFTNLTCGFRKDFCIWSQRQDPGLAKFEHITSTDKDRARGGKFPGAYIQVANNNTDLPNKAMLISPTIDRTTLNCCLSFRYQMSGSDIRDLSVWSYAFAERLHGDGGTRLWSVVGEKGKRWMEKKITVPPAEDFYIAFEAIGPVAIADIRFVYRGGC